MLTVTDVDAAMSLALHKHAAAALDQRAIFEVPLEQFGDTTVAATVCGNQEFERAVWDKKSDIAQQLQSLLHNRYPGTTVKAGAGYYVGAPAVRLEIRFPEACKYEGPWTVFLPKNPTTDEIAAWTAQLAVDR